MLHTTVGESMMKVTYDRQLTALLVIDPYNDFISEGGKVWDRLKPVAEANRRLEIGVGSARSSATHQPAGRMSSPSAALELLSARPARRVVAAAIEGGRFRRATIPRWAERNRRY